ncbi:MAG: hypothetical protein GYA45_03160 [Pelolinea sp.]|jgi:hypothetical protein|nr:hypothetical protein [Pelolinea sp.]
MKEIESKYLIERTDPQPEVRRNAEKAKDWKFAEEAVYLYRMVSLFKDNPQIRHDPCEQKSGHAVFFVQAGTLEHTIYKDANSLTIKTSKNGHIIGFWETNSAHEDRKKGGYFVK